MEEAIGSARLLKHHVTVSGKGRRDRYLFKRVLSPVLHIGGGRHHRGARRVEHVQVIVIAGTAQRIGPVKHCGSRQRKAGIEWSDPKRMHVARRERSSSGHRIEIGFIGPRVACIQAPFIAR